MDNDLTLRTAQANQPWTVPYSDGVVRAAETREVPHILATHTVLHAAKSLGKLAAVFERLDHPAQGPCDQMTRAALPTTSERQTIEAMSADLVTAALRLANLYSFDIEDALVSRVVEKNGRGFEPTPPEEPSR